MSDGANFIRLPAQMLQEKDVRPLSCPDYSYSLNIRAVLPSGRGMPVSKMTSARISRLFQAALVSGLRKLAKMAVRCKAPARKNAFNRLELTTPDGARRFCIASETIGLLL